MRRAIGSRHSPRAGEGSHCGTNILRYGNAATRRRPVSRTQRKSGVKLFDVVPPLFLHLSVNDGPPRQENVYSSLKVITFNRLQ